MDNLSLEQKIVIHLAEHGYITKVGDVTRALKDILYAESLITAEGAPGLKDDIKSGIESGTIEGVGECTHNALSNRRDLIT